MPDDDVIWEPSTDYTALIRHLFRSRVTRELVSAMKNMMQASYGRRHESEYVDPLMDAVLYCDDKDKLDLSVRYQGWNVLHVAAYHGCGSLIYRLCGKSEELLDLELAASVCYPQRASVLMLIAAGQTAALSSQEWDFSQAGFKMVYRLGDEVLRYRDTHGCTVLHFAAVHGVVKMVAALIERNVELEAVGVMRDWRFDGCGLDIMATSFFDETEDEDGTKRGSTDDPYDMTPPTPHECAEMRYKMQSKYKPGNATSQIHLKEVIELLKQALPQPEVPTAVPVIDQMLTVAMVVGGQPQNVATPAGPQTVVVPEPMAVGTFFQFKLTAPIPVAHFRAWPRDMTITTSTTATISTVHTDIDGDGIVDVTSITTTHTATTTVDTTATNGDVPALMA